MREVLRLTRERDAEAALWLEIIDLFDRTGAEGASALALARVAARASGRPVGVQDIWNGVALEVSGDRVDRDHAVGADVAPAVVAARLRGRNAAPLDLDGGAALSVSLEVGSGRIGATWLRGPPGVEWRPLDYLVVERLAAALASVALEASAGRRAVDQAAFERLLSGGLGEYELAQACRRAELGLGATYAVVALDQTPPNAVSLEALGALAERALGDAHAAVVGRTAVVVAPGGDGLEPALRALCRADDRLGFAIAAGLGEPVAPDALATSWEQAREALALRRMASADGRLGCFHALGDLHLLAQIPKEEVLASPLFRRLAGAVAEQGSPSDLDVLESYLDEGTLRRAADKVFLHHTSVEHRIKRIEEALDLSLADPDTRFEIHLVLKLYRMLQSRDAAAPLL